MYGLDKNGARYVHIRVYKSHRVYAEIVARGGEVTVRCRECFRLYRIVIRDDHAQLIEASPGSIEQPEP